MVMGTFKVFDRAASKPELVEVARTKTRDCCEKKNDILMFTVWETVALLAPQVLQAS